MARLEVPAGPGRGGALVRGLGPAPAPGEPVTRSLAPRREGRCEASRRGSAQEDGKITTVAVCMAAKRQATDRRQGPPSHDCDLSSPRTHGRPAPAWQRYSDNELHSGSLVQYGPLLCLTLATAVSTLPPPSFFSQCFCQTTHSERRPLPSLEPSSPRASASDRRSARKGEAEQVHNLRPQWEPDRAFNHDIVLTAQP
ncbi:hypothetical protein SKAU_G00323640 [Synaphobranchus kaupii]|uniref:Uncharacterized protein n=1 Tax=Synaphobranchus kaupii TaxID=118154 RepID=A0A9Q1IK13_SYNKA|nr:hypothetical protein SKAU_G00323640 [Synaphobranchus kaupii]